MPPSHQTPLTARGDTKPSPRSVPARPRALNRLPASRMAAWITLRLGVYSVLFLFTACALADAKLDVTAPSLPIAAHAIAYPSFISEASQRFDIPATWIRAVIHVEGSGNVHAVSPKGAMGLMQIMPDTWAELRLHYHLGADPFDPHDNILAGTAYLRELYDRFGAEGFFAAYNAGPKLYQDYVSGLRPLHGETKLYLAKLASLLPDVPIGGTVLVGTDASDWRHAALFTAPPASPPPSAIARSARPAATASSAAVSALTPHSDGLFVPGRIANRQ